MPGTNRLPARGSSAVWVRRMPLVPLFLCNLHLGRNVVKTFSPKWRLHKKGGLVAYAWTSCLRLNPKRQFAIVRTTQGGLNFVGLFPLESSNVGMSGISPLEIAQTLGTSCLRLDCTQKRGRSRRMPQVPLFCAISYGLGQHYHHFDAILCLFRKLDNRLDHDTWSETLPSFLNNHKIASK